MCSNHVQFPYSTALRQGGQQSASVAKEPVTSAHFDPGTLAIPFTTALKDVLSPIQAFSPAKATAPGIKKIKIADIGKHCRLNAIGILLYSVGLSYGLYC